MMCRIPYPLTLSMRELITAPERALLVSSRVASSDVAASVFSLSINAHYTRIRVVLRDKICICSSCRR